MLIMASVLVCGVTACQSTEEAQEISGEASVVSQQESSSAADGETSAIEEIENVQGGDEQPGAGWEQQNNRYMGEITAIEDNRITVVTVMRGGQFPGGMPEGEIPEGEFPQGDVPEGTQPAVTPDKMPAEGEIPEGMEPGEIPEGFEPGEMSGGETMELEISEDTVIMLDDENGEISDLQIGDFIQFVLDEDMVKEITVGMPQQDVPQKETQNNETTE